MTVLHECLVTMPHEDFVYLGDTARFPYGNREADELRAFALELAELLIAEGAKLLVVACNAATSAALPALRAELRGRIGVVGVVEPESRLAAEATRNGHVGLLATPATVASGAYARALEAAAPHATLHAVACPDLAPMIHRQRLVVEGTPREPITVERICEYLTRLSEVCGMKALIEPVTHRSDKYGWAGWIHWEASGAHFYAWDEPTLFFSVDIYACKSFDAVAITRFTREHLDAREVVARAF